MEFDTRVLTEVDRIRSECELLLDDASDLLATPEDDLRPAGRADG